MTLFLALFWTSCKPFAAVKNRKPPVRSPVALIIEFTIIERLNKEEPNTKNQQDQDQEEDKRPVPNSGTTASGSDSTGPSDSSNSSSSAKRHFIALLITNSFDFVILCLQEVNGYTTRENVCRLAFFFLVYIWTT
ncbi:hypothetical protein ACOBQJ_04370 [Pelotomaculum propionicicum]|uniref:hypothetical protein n=1 Tax=Pelotomaculum propionicicum TaxID=258475 RepID=UPI003B7CEAA2